MTDFTTNIDMNVRMMNEKLRVDRNFDILQRDVLIGCLLYTSDAADE